MLWAKTEERKEWKSLLHSEKPRQLAWQDRALVVGSSQGKVGKASWTDLEDGYVL